MEDKLKQAISTYNKIAGIYSKYSSEKLLQFQLNEFLSLLKGKKILDAGCGGGRDVEYFTEEGYDAIGIDLSEGLIKEAKKKKGKFIVMDFRKLSFENETFDGIWSMAGFIHNSRDDVVKSLKEFLRVLKKDGILYIAVREGEGEEEVRKEKYNGEPRIYVYFKKEEFENYLKTNGFNIISSIVSEDDEKKWVEIFARKASL